MSRLKLIKLAAWAILTAQIAVLPDSRANSPKAIEATNK